FRRCFRSSTTVDLQGPGHARKLMQPSTDCTLVGLGPDAPTGVDAPTIAAVGAECFFRRCQPF
ncbi:hypothetical protein N8295_03740, partial [Pseudomonadales bacterium]|nr:hypothetical protein [Pseudomonadales bacterium]